MQTGIGRLASGDDLYFYGGTYRVADAWFNPIPSGSSTNTTVVRAVAGEKPILDGGCPVQPSGSRAGWCAAGGSNGELYTASGKSYIQFGPGLTYQHFDNGFGNGVFTPGSSHHMRWTGNTWTYNGADWNGRVENDHDIYMAGGSCGANHDFMIDHNVMSNSVGGALHAYHYCQGKDVDFQNNLVINHSTGVFVCDDGENYRIVNNTFVGTWRRASITTYCGERTGPKPVTIRNNIFVRSDGGTQWERSSNSQGIEDHNIWYGGSSPGTGAGDKTSNPLLDSNLRPQSGSPAIDAGSSLLAPLVDYDGNARPQGAGFDIGAFETGGSPPPPPPPGDTTPPVAPSNLQATGPACTDGQCTLHVTFTAASDNVGVDHLNLYRPLGNLVGTDVGTATSTDFGGSLPRCSTQTMGLEAVDAAGNKSTVATVTGKTYCPTSLEITNFRRDPKTDTQAGVIWFAWTAPTAPVSKYNEYRDKNGDGVLQSTDLVYSGPTQSPDVVGGSLACGTTVLVGLEAVGTDGTVGPRVQAPMTTKAC